MKKHESRTRLKTQDLRNPRVIFSRMNGAAVKKLGNIAKEKGLCRSTLLSQILTAYVDKHS